MEHEYISIINELVMHSFIHCYTVMFASLVANWPFCINKFDLIWSGKYEIIYKVLRCLQ